jgi:hypothetical protein
LLRFLLENEIKPFDIPQTTLSTARHNHGGHKIHKCACLKSMANKYFHSQKLYKNRIITHNIKIVLLLTTLKSYY